VELHVVPRELAGQINNFNLNDFSDNSNTVKSNLKNVADNRLFLLHFAHRLIIMAYSWAHILCAELDLSQCIIDEGTYVDISAKAKQFGEYRIPTDGGDFLQVQTLHPKKSVEPRRVVFISPLVGAGAAKSLIVSRSFTRAGSILVSFEYRGHTRSSGKFELDRTVADVRNALNWARGYAADMGLPLHGFATCYGTVPLFAQFKGDGPARFLRSVSVVSALFRLNQILSFDRFAAIFSSYYGRELSKEEFQYGIVHNSFDWDGDVFRQALYEYLKGLFPELNIGRDHFEELRYDRANIQPTLRQLLESKYLEGVKIPSYIPCNVFMGVHDELMGMTTPKGRYAYADHVKTIVPHAEFHDCDIDHFGRGSDHDAVTDRLGEIFARYDSAPVPPSHLDFSRARSVHQ
jgi:hypothetical protein